MRVSDMAKMQNFDVSKVKNTANNKAASKNNQDATQATNQKNATTALKQDSYTPAGKGMTFEQFNQLINSDKSIEEKLAGIQEAFGDVVDEEALEISLQGVKNGKMSMEEMYKRLQARSSMLNVSESEALAMFEKSQKIRRPEVFSGNNDPENLKKYAPILNKVRSGAALTDNEKSFLREHYPDTYAIAMKTEQEVKQVKESMKNASSKEAAQQILLNAKMAAVSGGENSNPALFSALSKIDPNNPKGNAGINSFLNITV